MPTIISTKENISSFVHGIFKPVLVLPEVIIKSLSEEQLLALITHEFIHLKRRDPLIGWIVTICQVFYFFHPGYYLARYYILLDREIACDESVISVNRQCKSAYAQALLKTGDACLRLAPKAVAGASYIHLKKRLLHMVNNPNNSGRMSIRAILVLILMGLISIPGIHLTDRVTKSEAKIDDGVKKELSLDDTEKAGMKHYRNNEWNYELDIPGDWSIYPPKSSGEVGRFTKYGSNHQELRISLNTDNKPEEVIRSHTQEKLGHGGFGNFIAGDMVIGTKKVLTLDFDKSMENEIMSHRYYFIPHDSQKYVLRFSTTNRDEMFKKYDRIVKSFKIIEQPASISGDIKPYKSDKWDFSIDIPEDWTVSPPATTEYPDQVVYFTYGDKDGSSVILIFRDPHDPKQSLHEVNAQRQQFHVKEGVKNFITSETTIGTREAVMMEFKKVLGDQTWNIHSYTVADGTLRYTLGVGTTKKDNTIELLDRIAKTFRMHHEPSSNGFKRYKSYEGAFSLDIPGRWYAFPHDPGNNPNEMIRFASNEDGTHKLIIIRNPYPSDISFEALCDQSEKELVAKGFRNFKKARANIGSKEVIKLNYDKAVGDGVLSYSRYYFPDASFFYVLEFSTSNKKDMFGLYDRMATTFEILEEPYSQKKIT